jgi:hypothetical protein
MGKKPADGIGGDVELDHPDLESEPEGEIEMVFASEPDSRPDREELPGAVFQPE